MNLQAFQNFLTSDKIYTPEQIMEVLKAVRPNFRFCYTNKKLKYFNVPCAFDIETTSFYHDGEKRACMYEWSFCIFGAVIIGRTWDQYINMIDKLSAALDLSEQKRLVIYCHNLSYEFQFMRKHFTFDKVFALDVRKPLYAITETGIEYRCSYLLSGYSLAKLADQLRTVKLQKLTGDLDYTLMRHSNTPLTSAELAYCVNDVKIVAAYIAERIEIDGSLSRIPLTKTGYVRKYCRDACFYDPALPKKKQFKRMNYKSFINGLIMQPDEYKQLKRAFQGGFTHANPFYSGRVMNDVSSYDFTSSYPAVMIAEKFPMSAAEVVEIKSAEEFYHNLKLYCCLFDIEFTGLKSKVLFDSYISISRCYAVRKAVTNNGRVVSAEVLHTTLTEQDFIIIKQMYTWDSVKIVNFRRYKKDYLPTDFIKAILKLYQDKTTLKGVEGKEAEYLSSKEMVNSCYGMCVTDPVRDEIIYFCDWLEPVPADVCEAIAKYNKNPGRFLFYPWGVWVTAYARRNLFTGILEFKEDYIYADTDSIKAINAENHAAYILKYNQWVTDKLRRAMQYHGLDIDATAPETINGVKKPLGVWDYEGTYTRFKTLGAKRYMTESDHGINITVSGLNKKICVPYLTAKYDDPFEAFNDDLYVPPEYTGKNTHTYIDTETRGELIDYTGIKAEYHELSYIHLAGSDYHLSIAREYADYISGLTEGAI